MLIPALLGYAAVNHDSAESAVAGGMYDFTVAQLLQKLLPDQYDSLRYSGLPSVYCGSILLVLAIIFLGQKRSWKNKVRYLFLLLLPISGFLVPKIDYVLHGFRIPHGFVYRYAFIFSFRR